MRSLAPEEQELWDRVAATIRPLSRQPVKPESRTQPAVADEPAPRPRQAAPRSAAKAVVAYPSGPGTTLDSTWDRRLRSGSVEPDMVLDLHGMNLDGAWNAIDRALEQTIADNGRIVLLVTGHERPGGPHVQRGKIRSAVHDWLQVSRHAAKIAAVRNAHSRHGGGGSLYIILRRNRPTSTFS